MNTSLSAPDFRKIRLDFPILATEANQRPLVYLDNAATSQKPRAVIDRLDRYWTQENANVHRGVHYLSQLATHEYDLARERVRILLNAASGREVIFTKGGTEAINLVAATLPFTPPSPDGRWRGLAAGDEILVTAMEHHANIVPWQLVANRVGAVVRPIPITDAGELDMAAYRAMLAEGKAKIVGMVHVSNSLGTINPVQEMVALAHEAGAIALVDGAQAGPHCLIDVQDIDADFYTLSCHKIYAPTGIGVLYGRESLLKAMPPYQGGGDMIRTVAFEKTTYAELPGKFEAGTPNIAGAIGLAAAIGYLQSLGHPDGDPGETRPEVVRQALATAFASIAPWESELVAHATERLGAMEGLHIHGTAPEKAGIVAFTLDGAHPHDIGTILDMEGVAIRAGHHCCMPLMKRLGVPATARASFAFYNSHDDVERLAKAVGRVRDILC